MNIHAYTLDSLRRLVRALLKENRELKQQLKINPDIEEKLFTEDVSLSEYDEDQGSRIESRYITDQMAREFFALFHGRHDVFAVRGKNGGYYPKCKNFWKDNCPKRSYEKQNCSSCPNKQLEPLSLNVILKHLIGYKEDGTDVIGIYPLFSDGTCRFIVFDFDDHINGSGANDYSNINGDWKDEVSALREICKEEGISALVERSRSGNGAHVWILFSKPIRADVARNFGSLLLEKGRTLINLRSFNYFDRMFPTQDFSNGLGNLIALPLQGMALQKGNSAFVDEQWNAYPDQWEYLYNHVHRLSPDEIEQYIEKWQAQIYPNTLVPPKFRPKPWERNVKFNSNDVDGIIHIVLSDGVYVDTLNLKPRIQNQIRALAAFNNPIYYKNKGLGYSNYNQFSSIYLGCDINGYIKLPRGLREKLLNKCNDSGIKYEIEDLREKGRPIRVSFKGELKTPQEIASQILLSYEDGILSAAPHLAKLLYVVILSQNVKLIL